MTTQLEIIKGKHITLIPATTGDRQVVYEWCFKSETTKYHSGLPDYPEVEIPTYDEFCDEYYEEYFFTGERLQDGRGFMIIVNEEKTGFISYTSFHLKPSMAELDIWMNLEVNCGKGYGVDAIIALSHFLNETMGVNELIIAPSRKNIRAVKAYMKAGFIGADKPMSEYLLEEYVSMYGSGDYGVEDTALLIKRYD